MLENNYSSLVSPIDYRYGRPEVKNIFSESSRLLKMVLVEYAAARAQSDFNIVPRDVSEKIAEVYREGKITPVEVKNEERRINHDVMAMVKVLSMKVGKEGAFVHYGLTSNDVNDTATALQVKEFLALFLEKLVEIQETLQSLVTKYKNSVMLGRTHGQHASPITFGLKMAVFLSEFQRHTIRMLQAIDRILVGKLMGPVGTGAFVGRQALKVQKRAMEIIGLKAENNPTQLVGRDRYIEFLSILNNIVVTVERLATEIRNLQRPEIGEIHEFFNKESQVGSSSMPSKQNPVDSETVCSLSRMVRTLIVPQYEGSIYWHERDLTNSALERFTIPYASILTDFVVHKLNSILSSLYVNEKRMRQNLRRDKLAMSESVVKLLTVRGIPRQDAHEIVRKAAIRSVESGEGFARNILASVTTIAITEKDIKKALNPSKFLGVSGRICSETVRETAKAILLAREKVVELRWLPL